MKKYLINVPFILIVSFFSFSFFAFATVGGPTFISTFKYNPIDESVYYILQDNGGKGCPPELMKISLNTGKREVVYSCEEGEKLLQKNNYNTSVVYSEINKIIKDYKPLTQISLKDNRIFIDVNFVNSEKYPLGVGDDINNIMKSNFSASVYQDNVKVTDLPIVGCNKEQPFLFDGYAIPGFEKKIVLLLSSLGNCFEGGYINETLYVVGGVNNLNKTFYSNSMKDFSALIPSSGTLVVYEPEKIENVTKNIPNPEIQNETNNTINENAKEENNSNKYNFSTITIIIGVIISILLGVFIGRLFNRKSQ